MYGLCRERDGPAPHRRVGVRTCNACARANHTASRYGQKQTRVPVRRSRHCRGSTVKLKRTHIALEASFAYGADHGFWKIDISRSRSSDIAYRFLPRPRRAGSRFRFDRGHANADLLGRAPRVTIGVDFNVGVRVGQRNRSHSATFIGSEGRTDGYAPGYLLHATQTTVSAAVARHHRHRPQGAEADFEFEYLDFAQKESAYCRYVAAGRSADACRIVCLHAASHQTFQAARALRLLGIEVVEVRAAYSSKIGSQKYARRYGLSGHRAAASRARSPRTKISRSLEALSSRKRFATTL